MVDHSNDCSQRFSEASRRWCFEISSTDSISTLAAACTAAPATQIARCHCWRRAAGVIDSSIGSSGVQAREEASAGCARILCRTDRLELAPEIQEEAGKLWSPAEVELVDRATLGFPKRAVRARALLDRSEALRHAAAAGVHAARLTAQPR